MRIAEHLLACIGLILVLMVIAVIIDHFTNGNRRLWKEAVYD